MKESFTGPTSGILYGKTGTWTATVNSCGKAPYVYDWYLWKEGQGPATLIASGNPLVLKSVPAGSSSFYEKEEALTDISESNEGTSKQPPTWTNFSLYLEVTDANGAKSQTLPVYFTAYGKVDLIPWLMPKEETNSDEINNEFLELKNSLTEEVITSDFDLFIYPNPASSEINLHIVGDCLTGSYLINIYDINSKLHKCIISTENEVLINVDDLNSGSYILQVIIDDNVLTNSVIIK